MFKEFLFTLFMVAVMIYLAISLLITYIRLERGIRFEKDMSTVPVGDLEYFEKPILIDWLSIVFLPSLLITLAWLGIVKTINNLLYE